MALETLNSDSHNDNDSVIELLDHLIELSPDTESVSYIEIMRDSPEGAAFINGYNWLLENCFDENESGSKAKSFVGSGNNAIILRNDAGGYCMKASWEMLSVASKFRPGKKVIDLPKRVQGLMKVQKYFDKIKSQKRGYQERGYEFKVQNSIEREAIITMFLHTKFAEIGMADAIPSVISVVRYQNSEELESENIETCLISEQMNALHMDLIDGFNLEQLILLDPDNINETFDVDKFCDQLTKIFNIMHSFMVTHGDVSIRNIMIDRVTLKPVIIDFGTSKYHTRNNISEADKMEDMNILEGIIRLLKKWKVDPEEASKDLEKRHSGL